MEIRSSGSPLLDSRIGVIVTVFYLCFMLSVPVGQLSMLIWMALYPILASAWLGLSYGKIFLRSLIVLPIVFFIGIFNPVYDRTPVMAVVGISVSEGWISFISIIIRGLLAMQACLILIESDGFLGLCRGLSRLGVPRFLTEQLQFVYRYMMLLIEEAITMKRAREARGYGRKKYPIKLWGIMTGQLFLRAVDRSERIARAMEARGFNGRLPIYRYGKTELSGRSILYLLFWLIVIPLLRIFNLSSLFIK